MLLPQKVTIYSAYLTYKRLKVLFSAQKVQYQCVFRQHRYSHKPNCSTVATVADAEVLM